MSKRLTQRQAQDVLDARHGATRVYHAVGCACENPSATLDGCTCETVEVVDLEEVDRGRS